jgi:hypothetical protein
MINAPELGKSAAEIHYQKQVALGKPAAEISPLVSV